MPASMTADRTALALKSEARRLGFDLVGVAPAVTPQGFHSFREWLRRGYAGEMAYLPDREPAYEHPHSILETVRSIVMLGMNYNTAGRDGEDAALPAKVSRYAWGKADYHDVIRGRLKRLAELLHEAYPGCRTRGVVDTAPLLERDFARLAGLGWFGKNTMLINKRAGSWLFLAGLLTDVELDYDDPHESSHCGTCTRCLDACPTGAFPEPFVLDARRCISYLNIELAGPVPRELREGMGDWLFGCDVCQDVCPWNNKAPLTAEPAFQPADDLSPADAIVLLRMDEDAFRRRFRGTPLWRPKRAGLLRNAAIVAGNAGRPEAVPALVAALSDEAAVVRGAAAWALGELGGEKALSALRARVDVEHDGQVQTEIAAALNRIID